MNDKTFNQTSYTFVYSFTVKVQELPFISQAAKHFLPPYQPKQGPVPGFSLRLITERANTDRKACYYPAFTKFKNMVQIIVWLYSSGKSLTLLRHELFLWSFFINPHRYLYTHTHTHKASFTPNTLSYTRFFGKTRDVIMFLVISFQMKDEQVFLHMFLIPPESPWSSPLPSI